MLCYFLISTIAQTTQGPGKALLIAPSHFLGSPNSMENLNFVRTIRMLYNVYSIQIEWLYNICTKLLFISRVLNILQLHHFQCDKLQLGSKKINLQTKARHGKTWRPDCMIHTPPLLNELNPRVLVGKPKPSRVEQKCIPKPEATKGFGRKFRSI